MTQTVGAAPARPGGRAARGRLALALTPALLFGVAFIWRARGTAPDGSVRWVLFDDAMISMSYARTLAQTGELVWFPGADRVEGITNPLWTLYMALLHAVGLSANGVVLAVSLTGLACVLATGWVAHRVAQSLTDNEALWVAAAAVASLTYPLLFWSLRGMEVGAVTVAAVAAALLAIRVSAHPTARALLGLCAVVAAGVLLRFDFLAVAAVVAAWLLLFSPRACPRVLCAAVTAASAAVAAAGVTVWRSLYYGEPLPNTYTLKATGVPLGERLARGVDANWKSVAFLLLVVAGGAVIVRLRRGAFTGHRVVWLLAGITAATFTYSVYVGGDAWEFFPNRYVTPGLVTGSIIAVVGLGELLSSSATRQKAAVVLASLAVLASSSFAGYTQWTSTGGLYVYADHVVADWATALRRDGVVTDRAVLAAMAAGASQYYSGLPAVDTLGKSDPVVARSAPRGDFLPGHDRWDHTHSILVLRPDIVSNLTYVDEEEWAAILREYTPYCLDYVEQGQRGEKQLLVRNDSKNVDTGKLRSCAVTRPQRQLGRYLEQ